MDINTFKKLYTENKVGKWRNKRKEKEYDFSEYKKCIEEYLISEMGDKNDILIDFLTSHILNEYSYEIKSEKLSVNKFLQFARERFYLPILRINDVSNLIQGYRLEDIKNNIRHPGSDFSLWRDAFFRCCDDYYYEEYSFDLSDGTKIYRSSINGVYFNSPILGQMFYDNKIFFKELIKHKNDQIKTVGNKKSKFIKIGNAYISIKSSGYKDKSFIKYILLSLKINENKFDINSEITEELLSFYEDNLKRIFTENYDSRLFDFGRINEDPVNLGPPDNSPARGDTRNQDNNIRNAMQHAENAINNFINMDTFVQRINNNQRQELENEMEIEEGDIF